MRARRIFPLLAPSLSLVLLSGCGYVHLGKIPEPAATVIGDAQLVKENSDLKLEKKLLQQELAITRAQGDALRTAIENRNSDGDTSRRLTEKLNETTRELATLRAGYAQLQIERTQAAASVAESAALRARLGATEEKLAASLRTYTDLQDEIARLRTEVDRTRTENVALSEKVKTITAQNAEAQTALAQLNTQLLEQKDARYRAEQDAETLRTHLQTAAPNATALAQQRTGTAAEARSLAAEHAAEIAALKRELDASRTQLATLENERTQLRQQAGGAPSPELAHVEARLSTVLRENEQLKAASAQLTATRAELENQLSRLQNNSGAAQVQILREQLRDAQAQATALSEENARLKTRATGTAAAPRIPTAEAPVRIELAGSEPRPETRTDALAANPAPAAPTPAPAGVSASTPPTVTAPRAVSGVNATLVTSARGTAPRPEAGGRVHVVAGGDTLSKISALYYGTPTRWSEILAANRDILGESNNLIIGRTLRIP